VELEPPTEFYEHLGRVVVAGSALEAHTAEAAYFASGAAPGDIGDAWRSAARPTGALGELTRQAARLPEGDLRSELERLHADARALLDRRNKVVHSIIVLDMPDEVGGESVWLHFHPRTGAEEPLPISELRELTTRLNAVSARAVMLSGRAADYWRTRESAR